MTAIAIPLPEDIEAVRNGLVEFARAEVLPRHATHRGLFENPRRLYREDGRLGDEALALVREVRMAASKAGFYTMCVPESLGGAGLGMLAYYACWQELFRTCGSDAARLQTQAVYDGEIWRINGRKIWTTNSPVADYCIIFARTESAEDPQTGTAKQSGISAFLVPTDAAGFHVERIIRMFGSIGGDEAELRLEDISVQPWQLVGTLHQGFQTALQGVSIGRIYNAARAVGYGRWALEIALEHAKTREAFGKPIAEHQGVSFPLAESAMELHGAHLMGLNAAQLLDQGGLAIKELSMAKAYSVEIGVRAVDRAMQVHGAMGFTNEMNLTEAWHALRAVNVADGTNEILRRTIAQRLLKGDTAL